MAGVSGSDSVPLPTGDDTWQAAMTPQHFSVERLKAAKAPFSGTPADATGPGVYHCVCCGEPLFRSETQVLSGSGWPSFSEPIHVESLKTAEDYSLCLKRTEVLCAKCDAHLGHVFDDGPQPSGMRYCINAAALRFEEQQGKPS